MINQPNICSPTSAPQTPDGFDQARNKYLACLGEEGRIRDEDLPLVYRSAARGQEVLNATAGMHAMYPALAGLPLPRPIFIIGFLRTGSTLLHNLLSLHENLHAPRLWELVQPWANRHRNAQPQLRAEAQAYVDEYYRRAPDLPRIHFIDAELPDECHRLLANTFHSMVLEMRYRVPSYGDWLQRQSLVEPYRWHLQQLQLLMSAHRRGDDSMPTPVLKCPFHTWFLRDLTTVYKQCRFIHLHREPLRVVPSTASLCRTVRGAFSNHHDPAEIGNLWFRRITELSEKLADRRDELIGGQPVLDVTSESLFTNPLSTLSTMCRFLNISFSPAYRKKVVDHLGRHSGRARADHPYTCDEFGICTDDVMRATTSYRTRFLSTPERKEIGS